MKNGSVSRRGRGAKWSARLMLILLISLGLPLLVSCDRNRSADVQEYDLKDLRNRRDGLLREDGSKPTTKKDEPKRLGLSDDDADAEPPSTTPSAEEVTHPPVTQPTTTPIPTDPPTDPPTQAPVTDPPQTEPPETPAPPQEQPTDPAPDQGQTITVTFNTWGVVDIPTQTIPLGGTATRPEDPYLKGYHFLGWYIQGEDSYFNFDRTLSYSVKLTAMWAEGESDAPPAQDSGAQGTAAPPETEAPEPEPQPEPAPGDDDTGNDWGDGGNGDGGNDWDNGDGQDDFEEEPIPGEDEQGGSGDAGDPWSNLQERAEQKPEFKPAYQAQSEADQSAVAFVGRFLDYQGVQGSLLLDPFQSIWDVKPSWFVNYYLADYQAQGYDSVLLADIEARAQEEINSNIQLPSDYDYGNGYNMETASFNLSEANLQQPKFQTESRVTEIYYNEDGSISVEVTELQFQPLSGRSNAGLITAQDRVVGYYDQAVAGDANPQGEFYFPEAETVAQVRYHLLPRDDGSYNLAAKTWNQGMSGGLFGIFDLNESAATVVGTGSSLNVRALPSLESGSLGAIPDNTAIYVYQPAINGMYLAMSQDGSFPPGFVSSDYIQLN